MSNPPQVTLSVNGRFHAFDFAESLVRQGGLKQLITPYPRWYIRQWKIGHEQLTPLPKVEFARRLRERFSKIIRLKNGQFLFNDWFDRLAEQCLKEGADFFLGWSGNSLRTLKRAKVFGQRTILERHSAHIDFQQEILQGEFERFGLNFLATHPLMLEKERAEYEEAEWISVPSRFAKKSFLNKGFSEGKLLHHPLAVNLASFSPSAPKRSPFTILFAGNISLQKGVPYLLDAFTQWKNSSVELHLVGSVSDEMRPLLKNWLSDSRIKVFRSKRGREFSDCLSSASVVCLPSVHDGFNQVAVQAMACGSMVICSENTGSEELIESGKEGFVVPARNSQALIERFEWAFSHPEELALMGTKAREKVETGFSWDQYTKRRMDEFSNLYHRT